MSTLSSAGETPVQNLKSQRRGCLFTIRRVLKWTAIVLIALIVTGVGYQTVATQLDKRNYAPRGELYTVNGRQMHIVCRGEASDDSPTVILQAGGGADSFYWYWVQNQLAQKTQVCAYDRAGMGWSDPADTPRDPVTIVGELHALLQAASVQPPYVMAGHSYGTNLVRVYTAQYPGEVIGLILVDSYSTPLVDQSQLDQAMPAYYAAAAPLWLMYRLGVARFVMANELPAMGFPPEMVPEMAALRAHNQVLDTDIGEKGLPGYMALAQASAEAEDMGALPEAVLWASESYASYDKDFMAEVAAYSSNSVTRVIQGANHGSVLGNEQYARQVSDAILDVINSAETGQPLGQ